MNGSTHPLRRRRRTRPPTARVVVAIAGAAGFALVAAACGGSSGGHVARLGTSPTQSSSSRASAASAPQKGWLEFSSCMRSHGVSNYPDPVGSGPPPKESLQQLGISSARFQSARTACRHLLPNGGRPPNQAERQQARANALSFSRCVRAHGVPNFPDPDSGGRIPDPATAGIDQGSPRFQAANRACAKYRPPYIPSNSTYDTWARTHTGSGS